MAIEIQFSMLITQSARVYERTFSYSSTRCSNKASDSCKSARRLWKSANCIGSFT